MPREDLWVVDASASQLSPLTTNSIQNGCSEDTRCQQRQPKLGYWKKAVKGPMLVPNLPVLTSFTNAALEFFVSASWQSSGLNSARSCMGRKRWVVVALAVSSKSKREPVTKPHC